MGASADSEHGGAEILHCVHRRFYAPYRANSHPLKGPSSGSLQVLCGMGTHSARRTNQASAFGPWRGVHRWGGHEIPQGAGHRATTHNPPQHNGVAESLHRRLVERMRAILHESGLPKSLWAEALQFVVWVKNRTLTRALGNVTPIEKLTGKKPNIAGLPEWGQRVWVHTAGNSKLDARAATAHWVRYDRDSTHAHRIYWAEQRKVSVERDVTFTGISSTVSIPSAVSPPSAPAPTSPPKAPTATPASSTPAQATSAPTQPPAATDSGEEEIEVEDELVDPTPPPAAKSKSKQTVQPTCQSTRVRKPSQYAKRIISGEGTVDGNVQGPPGQYPDYAANFASVTGLLPDLDSPNALGAFHANIEAAAAAAVQAAGGDPKSLREAQSRLDWTQWKAAMDRELSTLQQAGMWETVPRPTGKNVVDCKWVYRTKYTADGSIEKHKARLVARGFTQVYGVDFLETYSPVAKLASLRTILALAARLDWDVECFDFNAAYLNGELKDSEEIYMEQPPGYAEGRAGFIKRLKKALYGLKQAGRRWYDTFARELADLGFHPSAADPGVFLLHIQINNIILILAVHVDDCTLP